MSKHIKKYKFAFLILVYLSIVLLGACLFAYLHNSAFHVMSPKGIIAAGEKAIIVKAFLIMLIAVVPTFILLFTFAWKYRAGNKKTKHAPNLQNHSLITFLIWAFPAAIIIIIGVMNWHSTHALDPYKAIHSGVKPITIQVVALEWKWLFIYPEQKIATVNFVEFPVNTPINFELTADAPMNSFWIPELGGQMYAMTGMSTELNLMANVYGEFAGSAAEINGKGFAGMKFVAKSVSEDEFKRWVGLVQQTQRPLTPEWYKFLAEPSENNPTEYFSSVEDGFYSSIMMQFMTPTAVEVDMKVGKPEPVMNHNMMY